MLTFDQPQYTAKSFKQLEAPLQTVESILFRDCTFMKCKLNEATFQQCTFENCTLTGCDLSLIKLPRTRFKGTHFTECRLAGINWCAADWDWQRLLSPERVAFDHCLLDHSVFIGLDLARVQFTNCKARHLDFESANLTGADFSGTDLSATRFVNCDLSEANFVGAENYQINAAENTLHQARFILPEAIALLHSLDIVLEE